MNAAVLLQRGGSREIGLVIMGEQRQIYASLATDEIERIGALNREKHSPGIENWYTFRSGVAEHCARVER